MTVIGGSNLLIHSIRWLRAGTPTPRQLESLPIWNLPIWNYLHCHIPNKHRCIGLSIEISLTKICFPFIMIIYYSSENSSYKNDNLIIVQCTHLVLFTAQTGCLQNLLHWQFHNSPSYLMKTSRASLDNRCCRSRNLEHFQYQADKVLHTTCDAITALQHNNRAPSAAN